MVSIPTRRVIRCQGKLKKWSLRLSGEAKVLKSKLNDGSYVQIRIWIHFRIELGSKYISSGRNSWSIDFFEFENPNKGCKKFSEKMTKLKFLKIWIFSKFSSKKLIKFDKKAVFQKIFCAAARPARPQRIQEVNSFFCNKIVNRAGKLSRPSGTRGLHGFFSGGLSYFWRDHMFEASIVARCRGPLLPGWVTRWHRFFWGTARGGFWQ